MDRLAGDGVRYGKAFCTAPSCTPSRNAMLAGVYQTRTDTQDQRRKTNKFPKHIKPGEWERLSGTLPNPVDPTAVQLPPYFPDTPETRKDWALYLDSIQWMDHIRCVRDERYKYIRNYIPANGYHECEYVRKHRPMWPVIRQLADDGALDATQMLLLRKTKPVEELYDLESDPHEVRNLAESSAHQAVKRRLSALLDDWIADTNDMGLKKLDDDRANIIQPRKKK